MKRRSLHIIFLSAVMLFLSSCANSIATHLVEQEGMQNERKAKNLLKIALVSQGWEEIGDKQVYQLELNDHWQGLSGKVGAMWGQSNSDLILKYKLNSFDGKAEFLNGKRKGDVFGIQAWNSYTKEGDTVLFDKKLDKKKAFALAATQYFLEIVPRLNQAELVTYAGSDQVKGQGYDLIFCTWKKLKPHFENDQYVLWLNQNTGLVDYVHYTVRDAAFPGNMISAHIRFLDYRNVDGLQLPFEQYVFLGSPKKQKKQEDYLHRFKIKKVSFDNFDPLELAPNKLLGNSGDNK